MSEVELLFLPSRFPCCVFQTPCLPSVSASVCLSQVSEKCFYVWKVKLTLGAIHLHTEGHIVWGFFFLTKDKRLINKAAQSSCNQGGIIFLENLHTHCILTQTQSTPCLSISLTLEPSVLNQFCR